MRKLIMNIIGILVLSGTVSISYAGITIDASNYQDNIVITGDHVTRGDVNGKILISTWSRATWSTHLRLWFLPPLTEKGRFINYVLPFNSTPDCSQELLNSPLGQLDAPFIRWANEYINSNPMIPFSNRVGDFKKPIERTVLHDFVTLTCVYSRKEKLVVYATFKNTRIINPPEGNQPEETECIPGVVTPLVPREIDFGTLDHNQLLQGVSEKIYFRFIDDTQDQGCISTLKPIVRFSSAEKVVDNEIHLSNGTILSFYNQTTGAPNKGGKIPLDTPIADIYQISDSVYQIIMDANLRSNPNQPLIAGPFSTTVVYQIEYR